MAGEEKLTQVEIRKNENEIIEVPLAPDLENIKYSDQKTAKTVIDELITNKLDMQSSSYQEGQILQIDSNNTIVARTFNSDGFASAFKEAIPTSLSNLNFSEDIKTKSDVYINEHFLQKTGLKNQIDTILQNDYKLYPSAQGAGSSLYALSNQISKNANAISNLQSRDTSFQTSLTSIEGLMTQYGSILGQHQSKINLIGDQPHYTDYAGTITSDLGRINNILVPVKNKMDRIIQLDTTDEHGMQDDIENYPPQIALGNETTNKIAIWGSPSNKINMYIINRPKTNGASALEKYGILMNPENLTFVQWTDVSDNSSRKPVAQYTPNTILSNSTLVIPAGTCCSGFITSSAHKIIFFIPTFENCLGKRVTKWNVTNSSISIRSTQGAYVQVVNNTGTSGSGSSTSGGSASSNSNSSANWTTSQIFVSSVATTFDTFKTGIKVTLEKNKSDTNGFYNATNNTPLSIYFVKSVTVTFA